MIHKAKTRSLELQSNTFLKAISIQNWSVGRTGLSEGSANTEKTNTKNYPKQKLSVIAK